MGRKRGRSSGGRGAELACAAKTVACNLGRKSAVDKAWAAICPQKSDKTCPNAIFFGDLIQKCGKMRA